MNNKTIPTSIICFNFFIIYWRTHPKDHLKKILFYFESQYDRANLNWSGLPYIPFCSKPTILSLHSEYPFIVPSVNAIPTYINKTTAIKIAADTSKIEDVFVPTCFDFVIKPVFLIGAYNKMLIIALPFALVFCSYTRYC